VEEKLFTSFCCAILYNIIGKILFHSDKLFCFGGSESKYYFNVLKNEKVRQFCYQISCEKDILLSKIYADM